MLEPSRQQDSGVKSAKFESAPADIEEESINSVAGQTRHKTFIDAVEKCGVIV